MHRINEELAVSKRNNTRALRLTTKYVAISPYSCEGATFVFIKKQLQGEGPPFIVNFEGEPTYSNLAISTSQATANPLTGSEAPHSGLQHVPRKPEETISFQWATSKKSGRPHARDDQELELKKGERVKVIRDIGRNWFLVQSVQDNQGYVHGSWLEFGDKKVYRDIKAAYTQFQQDVEGLQAVPGQLVEFPTMASYVDQCTKPGCQTVKKGQSTLGICVHDLGELLRASGDCSHEWLRDGRNFWHPDRFARFCHAEHVDDLKPMAEQMFVMHSKLMEVYKA